MLLTQYQIKSAKEINFSRSNHSDDKQEKTSHLDKAYGIKYNININTKVSDDKSDDSKPSES